MKKTLKLLGLGAILAASVVSCGPTTSEVDLSEEPEICQKLGISQKDLEKEILGDYTEKYNRGAAIVDSTKTLERYKAFAEAEYDLIYESAIIVPWLSQSGYSAAVSKTVPYQAGKASYGLTADKYKNVVVTNEAMTKEKRAAVKAAYDSGAQTMPTTADSEGFISLANVNANPVVGADGKYTVGSVSFDTKKVLNVSYASDVAKSKYNYLTNTWTYNSSKYTNMVDGLVENDKYGNIVGAIATKYKAVTNADGSQTWTFKLRNDAKWVKNSDGSEYGVVKAADFVNSIKYVLNALNASGTVGIVTGLLKGAEEYNAATLAAIEAGQDANAVDFSGVGAKAVDDFTLELTTKVETPYFLSSLTYSPFLPSSAAYMAEVGTKWGEDENHILVNGAFRQTETTLGSKLVFTKNDKYYDKDHVYIDTLVEKFIDGTAGPDTNRKRYEAGEVDSFTVSAKDKEGWKTYVTGEDGTGTQKNPAHPNCNGILSSGGSTYIGYYNFIRQNWKYNDNSLRKTEEERVATAQALRNKNFRKGFLYGLDVLNYLSQYKPGSEAEWLYRSYTNRELTYATDTDGKLKDYGEYVDEVYNREQGKTGVSLSGIKNAETNGNSDPVYDAATATKYFTDAKKALIDSGTLKESDFPIKIDVIADMEATTRAYEEEMYSKLERASNGVVDIQLNVPASDDENTDWGSISNNYDFSMWSGWGPDYADPQTFLHTMIVGGDMVEQLGF